MGANSWAPIRPAHSQCQRAYFAANQFACKCNETYCDSLKAFEWPQSGGTFVRVVSDSAGARFEQSRLLVQAATATAADEAPAKAKAESEAEQFVVEMEANKHRQQVTGFGGSFTDSAALVTMGLSARLRQSLLNDYFSELGLDYNLGRLPVGGSDMSVRAYSYDDLHLPPSPSPAEEGATAAAEAADLELQHFKLAREDLELKVPLIRRVNEMRAQRNLEPLKLLAAPWSPPAWMKNNSRLVQGSLRGNYGGPFYNASARYLMRFLDEYERQQGIPIWAISAQNEPFTPSRLGETRINFNSLNFSPEQLADYLEFSLIPTLVEAKRISAQKLFFYDDGILGLERYYRVVQQRPRVMDKLAGVAIHWYAQALGQVPYSELTSARRYLSAQLSLISSEACHQGGPKPGDWPRAMAYARDVMANLQAGSTAWIDWNLALNMSGGPSWVGNLLDAAVLVDVERQSYYKNPMFYALAQFTRFVRANSRVVPTRLLDRRPASSASSLEEDKLLDVVAAELAHERPNELAGEQTELRRRFSVVLLNRADEKRSIQLRLLDCKLNSRPLSLELAGQSVTSLAFVC